MTSEQVKAARALLCWNQKDLADISGVSLPSIGRLEMKTGVLGGYERTTNALKSALESAGIEFLDNGATSQSGGAGVRLKVASNLPESETPILNDLPTQ